MLAVATAGAWFAIASPLASANPTHPGVVIAVAGSDTTEKLMDQLMVPANQEFNIHVPETLHTDVSPTITVPADAACTATTYAEIAGGGNFASPNGSGAGRDALKGSVAGTYPDDAHGAGGGCIDIARSSAEPRAIGSDNATFEYYAMALDLITWASPSLQAPASMTLANLRGIYNCTITNWNQLPGGGSGQIQRFFPQVSSGTGATFLQKVLLNQDPHSVSNANCPAVVDVQENRGNDLLGANNQNAIVPYSNGKWIFQATNSSNPTLDIRSGARVGGLTIAPGDATSATYGVRYTGSAFVMNDGTAAITSRNVNDMVTTNGSTTITSATANFTQADVGRSVSGTNLPAPAVLAGGTPPTTVERIASVTNATTAVLSLAATGSGAGGSLTIGVGRVVTDASLTALSTTVTSATANFTAADVGLTLQFPNVATGGPAVAARITAVTNATTATMSAASQSFTGTTTMRMGPAPVSEANPNLGDPNDSSELPGARYLYNVLDSTSVNYAVAKTLV